MEGDGGRCLMCGPVVVFGPSAAGGAVRGGGQVRPVLLSLLWTPVALAAEGIRTM